MRTPAAPALVLASLLALAACTGAPSTEATPTVSPRVVPTAEPTPTAGTSPTPAPTPSPTPSPTTSPPPSPTPPATAAPTPSPTTAEDWTPPDPITDAYAQRVMQELYDLDVGTFEIVMWMARSGAISATPELEDAVALTRTSEAVTDRVTSFVSADPDALLGAWVDPPQPWKISDVVVLSSGAGCLQVSATNDPSPLIPAAPTSEAEFRLRREPGNPTGWKIDVTNTPDVGVGPC